MLGIAIQYATAIFIVLVIEAKTPIILLAVFASLVTSMVSGIQLAFADICTFTSPSVLLKENVYLLCADIREHLQV